MKVSVVMPALNSAATIEAAVASVRAQSFRDWELLIVDNGSEDGTLALAQGFAREDDRIRVLTDCPIRCAAAARRTGIDAAEGEFVAFLDSDDLWLPEKLALQLQTGEDFVFTGCSYMNADGSRRSHILHVPEKVGYPGILKQNVIPCSSVLVRRRLLEACFTETTNEISEDYAAWVRILRRGVTAVGLDQPLLCYRVSPDSLSGNKLRSAVRCWRMYRSCGLGVLPAAVYWLSYVGRSLIKYAGIRKDG